MGYEMEHSKTPSAWDILRACTYLCGGISIPFLAVLGMADVLSAWQVDLAFAFLIPWTLAADTPHVFAILKGDGRRQQQEQQAWSAATAPVTGVFQRSRQFWVSEHSHSLREVGAIGVDLARTHKLKAGRQSGGPKKGAGGHKKPAGGGSDDDGDGEPPAHLPLVWTTHDLAATLGVSAKTLQNQPPHHLPPAIRIPGCRGPRYRLQDVLAWLDGFSTGQRPARPLPRKVRGRPRIALSLGKGGVQ